MTRDRPPSPLALLRSRRYLPLFATQFLGALNDNFFKNAMAILILYRLAERAALDGRVMVAAASGVFILPFFLFSATAGQIADRFDKALVIRTVKLCEIAVMGLAVWGFAVGDPWLLLAVLFLMGAQSAFFGPVKYAILPDHLATRELVAGNAMIEAATFLAILLGTIAGGLLILGPGGVTLVSSAVTGIALAGWAASLFVPRTAPAAPALRISPNVLAGTWAMVAHAAARRDVFLAILGISWFWAAGATFLAQFPAFAKDVLGGNEEVVTLLLTVFSIGIALGSLLCTRLLGGEITPKYVPFGALGMAAAAYDLFATSAGIAPAGTAPSGAIAFLAKPESWRVLADLALISGFGGLYIVPLYAILQARADEASRARTIAANNVLNALAIVVAAALSALMLSLGWSVSDVFLAVAVASACVAVYICRLLPRALVKTLAAALFRLAFRAELRGAGHLRATEGGAVVVVNHVSFLDAALLAALLPGEPVFAIDTRMARRWWVRPFLLLVDAVPIDPTSPFAAKALIREVRAGRTLVIFPEGRLTTTGALMKVYEGPGMIADKAGAPIVPVQIEGAQHTWFSRLGGTFRRRLLPRLTLTVHPPRRFSIPAGLRGRARRRFAGARLYDLMSEMSFATGDSPETLFQALLGARRRHGGSSVIVEDIERRPLSYDRLVLGALVLGRRLRRDTAPGEAVGLLLPNAAATVVAFFGLQAFGRVPAMLNVTAGEAGLRAACRTARLKRVVTSRRFIDQARLGAVAGSLAEEVSLIHLEDLRAGLGPLARLRGLLDRAFAARIHRLSGAAPEKPAAILFTSGSEGAPKGVVLSHRNILANCRQLAARVDFNPRDRVFNALPLFHAFGLTAGMVLPAVWGTPSFLYPSPLHYRVVPELAYLTNATILFGTDTFLGGYARAAHPYDFHALRYVFAGAEKVREETRRAWAESFGLRILEGYGATECAPVIATNTPMQFRAGTVGRPLPGIETRIEPVPGIEGGGRLFVRGPNVMLGYLLAEEPGVLRPPPEGWYDTGDIVAADEDGYLSILGRAKRFIKVAGEMVSLGAVEALANDLWPDSRVAALGLPDARRGEQLVLVTDRADARREALLAHAQAAGAPELLVPRKVVPVDALPLLGTGKIDYVEVGRVAAKRLGAAAA